MFEKILLATDLSEASERVVCAIGKLRALGASEVLFLHCLNIRDVGTLASQLMLLSRPSFEKQKKLLDDQGYKVNAKMILGIPHIDIMRQAEEHDCSLIVLGSHGRSMVAEILLGGTATAVLQTVTKPVLLFHLKFNDDEGRKVCEEIECDPRKHILFPTDFSDTAERAFTYVEEMVKAGTRKVTLCHVQDKSRIYGDLKAKLDEFNRIDTERLKRLEKRLRDIGTAEVSLELPYGAPKEEILKLIERNGYSMIVMGTQGRGFFGKILMGSVAYHVARIATIPTLFIPPVR